MLQLIKKIFSSKNSGKGKKNKDNWAEKTDFAKGYDWSKQFKEMGKLRGKLILM